jgi:N-acetylmuramidase/Putative peptidoglycan binding domain
MVDFSGAGTALSQGGVNEVCQVTGADPAAIWSVIAVETSGYGFLPDRRPKILFERHIFHRLTGGRFDNDDPDVSQPTAGGYGPGGAHQYERLAAAILLDRDAALQSASWGLGQVMGENFKAAGFRDVDSMVQEMLKSEDDQALAAAKFMNANAMGRLLASRDWEGFARRYNGPNFAANDYSGKLHLHYQRFADHGLPDLQIRAAQIYLGYRGFPRGGRALAVDGILGPSTQAAIREFEQSQGLAVTGAVTPALITALLQ